MKYTREGPFVDPVVRCDACNKVVVREDVLKVGGCPSCGNRRVREVSTLTGEEVAKLREWDVDPAFLDSFEEVEGIRSYE